MTTPDEDEAEARTARLLRLSVDEIAKYNTETICDWLIARNEQHCARLRAACQTLRELARRRERAHARIAATLTAPPTA
ncbi:hypothetical protein ACFYOF_16760 [Streptomyces sp. NPDC007148]|uniref:hypothetical protein n=1 Tax=Streptomyces sp. NPDC007148 TaxID=3364775 RepID=UPI00367AB7CD